MATSQKGSGTPLAGNNSGREQKTKQTTQISQPRSKFLLKRGKMTWMKAVKECDHLLQIHNEFDQAAAVKIVNGSGLDCVTIGAYVSAFKWKTTGGHNNLLYSDWAGGEPGKIDGFACLSKRYGYKWEGRPVFQKSDAVLCE